MKTKLSHRWRIALAAAAAAALLFGGVLFTAHAYMAQIEKHGAEELLDAPMSEVINSLKSGEPLDEEVGAQDRVTVVVFDPSAHVKFRSGTAPLGDWRGEGEASVDGHSFLFRSATFKGNTVVAVSDWTAAKGRLDRTRIIFLVLILPLAAAVGIAAYVAAGLMYRPLRQLTASAREIVSQHRIGLLKDPLDPDFTPLVQELNARRSPIRVVSDPANNRWGIKQ